MGSNSYGFDFLRTQHKVEHDDIPAPVRSVPRETSILSLDGRAVVDASHKPELEKQQDILYFLKKHRESSLAPSIIYRATGVNLDQEVSLSESLQKNPKIRTEFIPDPENPSIKIAHYSFQAKYPRVRDRGSLLAQVNAMTTGVKMSDLLDCYTSCEEDIAALITAGDIIAIVNTEDKDKILFPRGDSFLVELDGFVNLLDTNRSTIAEPNCMVAVDVDPTRQIRRGEAVRVGGQWFRVSSAIRHGGLSEQPTRAMAPLSVVSFQELPKRNEQDGYIRPFTSKLLPLDNELSNEARDNLRKARSAREHIPKVSQNSHANASNPLATNTAKRTVAKRAKVEVANDPAFGLHGHSWRHGCTTDVRTMFLGTRDLVPESDKELQEALVKNGLLGLTEMMRLPRLSTKNNLDSLQKPKKRRYYERKNQRITNTHLNGTEIGANLARALELQNQGKTVGDGGM